jgi:hypothetical protein
MTTWLSYLSDSWLEWFRAAAELCGLWSLEWACLQEQWRRQQHDFEDDGETLGVPCSPIPGVQ